VRRLNAVLTAVILVLFIAHAVMGSFLLIGAADTALKAVAWICLALVLCHTVISTKLTIDTLRICRRTGAPYFRQNAAFWAKRISGFAVMILLAFHMFAISGSSNGLYRLKVFDSFKLASQLLLVAAIAVHVLSNVRPLLTSFGIKGLRARRIDIILVLAVIMLLSALAFIIYYLRWSAF